MNEESKKLENMKTNIRGKAETKEKKMKNKILKEKKNVASKWKKWEAKKRKRKKNDRKRKKNVPATKLEIMAEQNFLDVPNSMHFATGNVSLG